MSAVALSDSVVDELVGIVGAEDVFADISARTNRARVPAPFPLHRWDEHIPDIVVLPRAAEQVSEVVKLANRLQDPGGAARRRHRADRRGSARCAAGSSSTSS